MSDPIQVRSKVTVRTKKHGMGDEAHKESDVT